MIYRTVTNVPDQDWARNVVDWGIENKMIVITDDNPDDWSKGINYGQVWTLFERMLG